MSNPQPVSGVLFNNKLYQKRPSSKALCLNPTCKARRLCHTDVQAESSPMHHQDHQSCQGWLHSVGKLRKWNSGQDNMDLGSVFSTDYLQNPIESIYYVQKFASVRWEDHLFSYFQRIKSSIQDELSKIFIKCQRTINDHLLANSHIFTKLRNFYESVLSCEEGVEQLYEKMLENDLKSVQKIGLINLSNNQLMNLNLSSIIDQLKSIQLCIWSKESKYDISERAKIKSCKQELINFSKNASIQEINNKVHQISLMLKSTLQYFDEDGVSKVSCAICSKTLYSKAQTLKQRKQECKIVLLDHLLSSHINEIAVILSEYPPTKLSLEEFKNKICLKNMKKVVIVDKQNMGSLNYSIMANYPDYYCVEVISKHTEKNAKGKYLLAESRGKDAADILIVVILTELSKLNMKEIVLLTKDHFGETLQPIFQSFGIKVLIAENFGFLGKPSCNFMEEC